MTLLPTRRQLLPMTGHTKGSRSAATCHFRCGDACLTPQPSTSTSPAFRDIADAAFSRRHVLAGLGLSAFAVGVGSQVAGAPGAAATATGGSFDAGGRMLFDPIAPVASDVDGMTVPPGYEWAAVVAWGDPVVAGAPAFDLENQTAAAQELQFGYNNDFLAVLPIDATHALMVVNHEYTNENIMFPGFVDAASLTDEQMRIAMAAHGMSVVQVRRSSPTAFWQLVPGGRRNRRITALSTEFEITGPVAGTDLVRTGADPDGRTVIGTLNNCAGGTTPWGSVLSGEENINQYFTASPAMDPRNTAMGITGASSRGWERIEPRFDTAQEPNEVNRFGWIVEVNPWEQTSTPRKHTALGRFKHEGATTSLSPDGHVVAYMGDDEANQHLYKFVSRRTVHDLPEDAHSDLLDEGDLYTAVFTVDQDPSWDRDGTGSWVPLTKDGASVVPGMSLEEVLVFTRQAAAAVGATPLDRPEDVERNPVTGKVYVACTNNTGRKAPGPTATRANNRFGHIIEIVEHGLDQTATAFDWSVPVICGDPADPSTWFSTQGGDRVTKISCPDNIAFDAAGGLWIATDGQPGSIDQNDALHRVGIDGEERGTIQQFLAVPTGAETCGPVIDIEEGVVFISVQHPGETDEATIDAPVSGFPYDGVARTPRPAVVQVKRS